MDEAFSRLRGYARARRQLTSVAEEVVAGILRDALDQMDEVSRLGASGRQDH